MTVSSSAESIAPSPVANGRANCPGEGKVRITLDLVATARRHLAFLKSFFDSTFLYHTPTIHRSIRRYNELWMPLISGLHRVGSSTVPMILPPLDVQWVWHCHCLAPSSYREYCVSRFGRLVDRPAIFDNENDEYASHRCREIWAVQYPSEPFDYQTILELEAEGDGGGGINGSTSYAGGDLFDIVVKHRSLYSVFSGPFVGETVYLVFARQRYMAFLQLCRQSTDGAARMVPTSDILLMLLTHQSYPGIYARDMEGIMVVEKLERRVVGFGERAGEEEREETMRIWEMAFEEPYERAGAVFNPSDSSSRVFFYWEEPPAAAAAAAESNRKYKTLQPRSLMEVSVYLKGKQGGIEAKDAKLFLRLRTVRCHKEMKLDRSTFGLSSASWQRTWHLCCELGTRGVILELRRKGSNCLGNNKLVKSLVFLWSDLLRAPSLTITKHLEIQLIASISVTPPVQAPYLLKCVSDRVTDDKGAMISDVILRMNNYHPQEGRWLSRTVLDHAGRECFVIRFRIGEGFWRRGAETPKAVKWEDRIIEVLEGPWSYIASSVGTAPQKVVGTAVPKEKDLEEKKVTWSLSTGDVLRIQWQKGLEFQLEHDDSAELARLEVGKKLPFQVRDAWVEDKDSTGEEEFLTLVRFTQENPSGRATALINWRLLAVELLPEEDAVFILLLCMAVVRTMSEISGVDVGHLLVRRRAKEATRGIRDWGSVMLPLPTCSSPHLKPWFWNPREVLTSAGMLEATHPTHTYYSPADGKDDLYKHCIIPSR